MDYSEEKLNKNRIKTFNNKDDPITNFPNGWIPIIESRDIRTNQSKPVIVLGNELVVFRGVSGEVYVMDAFCPHLGANLGVGGKVVNDSGHECIRCPFHGWIFRGRDGMCQKVSEFKTIVSGTESQIPNARIKVWQSIEINGFIYVWNHAEEEKPNWCPTRIQEIDEFKLVYRGRAELIVNGYVQDVMENLADVIHFDVLHRTPAFFSSALFKRLFAKIAYNEYDTVWKPCSTPEQHKASFLSTFKLNIFGYPVFESHQNFEQIGPAYFVTHSPKTVAGMIILLSCVIPIESRKFKLICHGYSEPTFIGKFLCQLGIKEVANQVSYDVVIWDNKKFLKNPVLHKSDKSIAKFRRWYSQFYSESSFKKPEDLWW